MLLTQLPAAADESEAGLSEYERQRNAHIRRNREVGAGKARRGALIPSQLRFITI